MAQERLYHPPGDLINAYYHAIQILRRIQPPGTLNMNDCDDRLKTGEYDKDGYVKQVRSMSIECKQVFDFGLLYRLFTTDPESLNKRFVPNDDAFNATVLAAATVASEALWKFSLSCLVAYCFDSAQDLKDSALRGSNAGKLEDAVIGYFGRNPIHESLSLLPEFATRTLPHQ